MSQLSSKQTLLGLISTCEQIHSSPINTSKSKQLYSFPKSSRFQAAPKQNCTSAYYCLPSARSHRSTSFGYGTKSDFTKSQQKLTPAPNYYQNIMNSFDDKSQQHTKGFSFGLSREVYYYKSLEQFKELKKQGGMLCKKSPGPGTYQLKSTLSDLKYSLRPRTKNPCYYLDKTTNKQSPGPGTYSHLSAISKTGKQFLSKYLSSGVSNTNFYSYKKRLLHLIRLHLFVSRESLRVNKNLKNFPGPNHYHPKAEITPDGKYFVSNFHSSQCRSFPKLERAYFQIQKGAPGPGTYRTPSEFGYYDQIL